MGALGWSEGAGPSSVVCASALIDNTLENANAKTANIAPNRLFINHLSNTKLIEDECNSNNFTIRETGNCRAKLRHDERSATHLFSVRNGYRLVGGWYLFVRIGRPQPRVVVFGQLEATFKERKSQPSRRYAVRSGASFRGQPRAAVPTSSTDHHLGQRSFDDKFYCSENI